MKKFINVKVLIVLLAIIAIFFVYKKYISPTYIAFVGYKDFQFAEMAKIKDNFWVRMERISREDIINKDLEKYKFITLFGMGLNLNAEQKESLKKAIKSGSYVYVSSSTNNESNICNLMGKDLEYIESYMGNGGQKNIQNMYNYIRRILDNKKIFSKKIEDPVRIPFDTIFHIGKDNYFESYEKYQEFYIKSGLYKENRPRVCFISSIKGGPRSIDKSFVDNLIDLFEKKDMNVYSVSGFMKRLEFLKKINPDIVVYVPHGRLNPGRGEQTVAWLKEKNIPLLCPIDVMAPYEEWKSSQKGLTGGMLSQSIVVPELDGGIEPYAVSAQFKNKDGLFISREIEKRLKTFVNRTCNWLKLKEKKNEDKKIAIVYYKGPGRNAMVAGGLEVTPSLLNVLKNLKNAGYKTGDLPNTVKDFQKIIQKKGPVIGPYAKGRIEEFINNSEPELVPVEEYLKWAKEQLEPEIFKNVIETYGEAPGDYLGLEKNGRKYIALPVVKFENIVLLPQLMPAIGENTSALVHGAKQAPPHPYIAEYLWIKNGFKADALMHFGTHGSFEFLPWKQTGLSSYDWSDALIDDLPHPYFYIIQNIGEAVIAKRRSYATLISYLTPPFMQSDTYGPFQEIHDKIHNYMSAEKPELKQEYLESIKTIILENDIQKDLGLENLNNSKIDKNSLNKIHNYIHVVEQEKVSDGLYTAGIPYTDLQADNTVRSMAIDSIAYNLAKIDLEDKKITQKEMDNLHFFEINYRDKALNIIDSILSGSKKADYFIKSEHINRINKFEHTTMNMSDDQFFADMFSMMDNSDIDIKNKKLTDKDKENIHSIISSIFINKEKLDYVKTLRDQTKLQKSLSALKPENKKKMKRISKFIPAMGKALEILWTEDVSSLVSMMKNSNIHNYVFKIIDNPDSIKGFEEKKKKYIEEILKKGSISSYKNSILTLYSKDKTETFIHNKGISHIENLINNLNFYFSNIDIFKDETNIKNNDLKIISKILNNENSVNTIKENIEFLRKKKISLYESEKYYVQLLKNYVDSIKNINNYKNYILGSTEQEMKSIINVLSGGYISPSSGGDPIGNPNSVPTGRNLYAINAQKAPTEEAWRIGKKIAQNIIDKKLSKTGKYPKKVAFSLWGGEFIRQQGIQLATIFHLLGTEPIRNSRGSVHALRLVPSEELKRPRIDVLIQTSGQFRDIAPSRMFLIDEAVKMAKNANSDDKYENFVYNNSIESEKKLIKDGMSPEEARKYSTARIFGGLNGNYGTGIMGMVEAGDKWEDREEIAEQYLNNMGAVYTEDDWGTYKKGLFESSITGTDTLTHGRSSNTWGPLSLDHVYEFMGGMSNAIKKVTGKEADAMFTDIRNIHNPTIQTAEEAIWTEARTTVLNPKYIKSMQKGGANSAGKIAETVRNTYGWNSLRPQAIDNELWDNYYKVYVDDKYNLEMEKYFENKNPYALQEITAVMLETNRKGMWKATEEQIKKLSQIHTELIKKYNTACSGFVCNNSKLQKYISQNITKEQAKTYNQKIKQTKEISKASKNNNQKTVTLKKEEINLQKVKEIVKSNLETIIMIFAILILFSGAVFYGAKKRK